VAGPPLLGVVVAAWCALGGAGSALADFVDVWMESPGKSRLVVLQQKPDLVAGFDEFLVVELNTKALKVVKSTPLAQAVRKDAIETGLFEYYLDERDRQRRKIEKGLVKQGFAVPEAQWTNNPPGVRSLVVESGGTRLVLAVTSEKGKPVLKLSKPGEKPVQLSYTEVVTGPMEGVERDVTSFSFRHLMLGRKGRVLVAVIREMTVPAPENFPQDRLLLVPLSKPLKALGIKDSLSNYTISLP
jgi:hypothetical protein